MILSVPRICFHVRKIPMFTNGARNRVDIPLSEYSCLCPNFEDNRMHKSHLDLLQMG
jgi:hypothetical protein